MTKTKNVLVTGANCSLASAFVAYLTERGLNDQYLIYGTSRTGNKVNGFHQVFRLDFSSNDVPDIAVDFDYVFHLAAALPRQYRENADFTRINVDGPIKFFERISFNAGGLFLNISSWDVYAKPNSNISEGSPKTTDNYYGMSKLLFEEKITSLLSSAVLTVISVRVPCLLIPSVKGNFMAKWKNLISEGESISIANPDSTSNAFIDGASIFRFALDYKSVASLSFNVGAKNAISLQHIAQIVAMKARKKLSFETKEVGGESQHIATILAEKYGFVAPSLEQIVTTYSQ